MKSSFPTQQQITCAKCPPLLILAGESWLSCPHPSTEDNNSIVNCISIVAAACSRAIAVFNSGRIVFIDPASGRHIIDSEAYCRTSDSLFPASCTSRLASSDFVIETGSVKVTRYQIFISNFGQEKSSSENESENRFANVQPCSSLSPTRRSCQCESIAYVRNVCEIF
jgi:hypothetical protein